MLADDNDVRDVIIICQDHISCVFDGLSNTKALGIPADITADEKLERVLFCYIEAKYTRKFLFRSPARARN